MSEKEKKYREILMEFAMGRATEEQVRAADPLRETIREASKLAAKVYAKRVTPEREKALAQ